jgi:hypothetical protein
MGARVAVPQDAPGRGTNPAPLTPGETVLEPNRTEPERPGSLLWKGSPAVYGGRGRHDNGYESAREPLYVVDVETMTPIANTTTAMAD